MEDSKPESVVEDLKPESVENAPQRVRRQVTMIEVEMVDSGDEEQL